MWPSGSGLLDCQCDARIARGKSSTAEKTLPTVPILPVDLYSRGTASQWDEFKHTTPDDYIHNYPEVIDLKVNAPAGTYDVVAMTNWRSWTDRRSLAFDDKLSLDPDASFVAFDFWNQKIEGVFKNRMSIEIAPHDTRVFQIHPLLNHPQLVGNSRHISGAYSVLRVNWDDAAKTLSGSAQGVSGAPYTLWIYVPKGQSVSGVTASAGGRRPVTVTQLQDGNALKVTFKGESEPVNWEVAFVQDSR